MDLPQPLLFNEWVRAFEASLLSSSGATAGIAGARYDVVAYALSPAGAWWCRGECGPQLTQALAEAVAGLTARRGPAPEGWRWGAEHRAIFSHPLLGQIPLLSRLATWSIEQPGDDTTVYRGGTRTNNWLSVHGAGYRGVYDLADLDRSLFTMTPGESAHPLRRTAASLMQLWRDGTGLRLEPRADVVDETLQLLPSPSR
jgi:penicillin amidase